MTEDEYIELEVGDLVTFVKTPEPMLFGWGPGMKQMLGSTYPVVKKVHNSRYGAGVKLSHPNGSLYTIDINHVELAVPTEVLSASVSNKTKKFAVNNCTYKQRTEISTRTLELISLKQDVIKFNKVFGKHKKLTLDTGTFIKIQKECPRLIGVMLSNNILTKNREM